MDEDEKVAEVVTEEQKQGPAAKSAEEEAAAEQVEPTGEEPGAADTVSNTETGQVGANDDEQPEPPAEATEANRSEEQAEQNEPVDVPKVICPKCGAENDTSVAYCPKCGNKLEDAAKPAAKKKQAKPAPSISLDELATLQESEKPKKADAKAWLAKNKVVAAIAAAVVVVLAVLIVPPLLATPDDLFEQGKYEQAYNKSVDEDKPAMLARICGAGEFQTAYDLAPDEDARTNILVTNLAARECITAANALDNPSTFYLKNIYWTPKGTLVINFSGDSHNDVYAYYIVNESDTDYKFMTLVGTLEEETINRYDTYTERGEKAIDNAARIGIKNMKADSSCVIDSIWVDAINSIHKGSGLDNVMILDDASKIYRMSN